MIAESVWILTLVCLALLAGVFIYVVLHSTEEQDYAEVQGKWYRFRSKWIVFLFGFGVVVAVSTLLPFPVINQVLGHSDATVVKAVGHQWYWTIDKTEYQVGEPIEFHVTAADVNHGFAIYNAEDRIVTQTQAMPGYVNKLAYTFNEPGTYRVLCLEYCGVAHHSMIAELIVKAGGEK
jgi:cytochrome c oxidase subunit 2